MSRTAICPGGRRLLPNSASNDLPLSACCSSSPAASYEESYSPYMVASSKVETVLVSSMGDVLVCRCRDDAALFVPQDALDDILAVEDCGAKGLELDIPYETASDTPERSFCESCHTWMSDRASACCMECALTKQAATTTATVSDLLDFVEANQPGSFRSASVPRLRTGLLGGQGGGDLADHKHQFYNRGTVGNGRLGDMGAPVTPTTDHEHEEDDSDADGDKNDPDTASELHNVSVANDQSYRREHSPSLTGMCSDDETCNDTPLPSFDYSHYSENAPKDSPHAHLHSDSDLPLLTPIREIRRDDESDNVSGRIKLNEGRKLSSPLSNSRKFAERTGIVPGSRGRDVFKPAVAVLSPANSVDNDDRRFFLRSSASNHVKREVPPPPLLMHGIPTFFSSMSQIKVTKVSAHPLGSHVLLISSEALLFSYGRNDHGQLGQGLVPSDFVLPPMILTPLLENGGKAIDCAAGFSHSLVVVKTEGSRIDRLQTNNSVSLFSRSKSEIIGRGSAESKERAPTSPSRSEVGEDNEPVCHHQVYGFGQNDFMKLGLIKPSLSSKSSWKQKTSINMVQHEAEDDVWLPRRVALHCRVWLGNNTSQSVDGLPCGIFAVAASVHHSGALVRRANGATEVYTWGKASDSALGLPLSAIQSSQQKPLTLHGKAKKNTTRGPGTASSMVPIPTLVEKLTFDPSLESLTFPVQKAIVSNDASLGQRKQNDTTIEHFPEPTNSRLGLKRNVKLDYPVGISLGPSSTFVVTSMGRCLAFGSSEEGLLGLGYEVRKTAIPTEIQFGRAFAKDGDVGFSKRPSQDAVQIVSVSVGARHAVAVARDGKVFAWGVSSNGRTGHVDEKPRKLVLQRSFSHNNGGGKVLAAEGPRILWEPRFVHVPDPDNTETESNTHFQNGSDKTGKDSLLPPLLTQRSFLREYENGAKGQLHSNAICSENQIKCTTTYTKATASIVCATAGYDNTIFVTKSGKVLSCGLKSGRLGQGDVRRAKPLFGGLHVWYS